MVEAQVVDTRRILHVVCQNMLRSERDCGFRLNIKKSQVSRLLSFSEFI